MKRFEPVDFTTSGTADLYDELPLWSAPFGLRLLDLVPIENGLTYLDVGCGTGYLTVELAQRSRSRVIAVDPWTTALDRLRRKIAHIGLDNVAVYECDAVDLDIPAGSVDVVISNLGVNNFADPGAVMDVLFRVARPNARFVLTTNLTGHMAEFFDVFRATLVECGMRDRMILLEEHIAGRGTTDTVRAMLTRAGFAVDDVATDTFAMRYADGTAFLEHYFIRLGFIQSWRAVVGEENEAKAFRALEANLNDAARDSGELRLTIPVAIIGAHKPE